MLMIASGSMAQDIKGVVIDGATKEPHIGATIQVKGTQNATVTDIDGKFHLTGLNKNGRYCLTIKYVAYQAQNIDGVQTKPEGEAAPITVALKADEQQLGEVTVTAVERKNTEAAMLQATKNSSVIVSQRQ